MGTSVRRVAARMVPGLAGQGRESAARGVGDRAGVDLRRAGPDGLYAAAARATVGQHRARPGALDDDDGTALDMREIRGRQVGDGLTANFQLLHWLSPSTSCMNRSRTSTARLSCSRNVEAARSSRRAASTFLEHDN